MYKLFAFLTLGFLVACSPNFSVADKDNATVKIILDRGHGSGVVIGDGTTILTAKHVVEADTDGIVTIKTNDGHEYKAKVVSMGVEDDVAKLKLLDDVVLPAAKLADSNPVVGDSVEVVGHPVNLEYIHTYGHVSSYQLDVMVYDATTYLGNSGGPIFNEDGEVVGIVSYMYALSMGGMPAPIGYYFAEPVSDIREALDL